jgi:hypothetical protein
MVRFVCTPCVGLLNNHKNRAYSVLFTKPPTSYEDRSCGSMSTSSVRHCTTECIKARMGSQHYRTWNKDALGSIFTEILATPLYAVSDDAFLEAIPEACAPFYDNKIGRCILCKLCQNR